VCIFTSTKAREYGAARFLKWFTAPEQNLPFTTGAGYIPVEKEAYGEVMNREIGAVDSAIVRDMLGIATAMQKEYRFYYPPVFDGFEELQNRYVQQLQRLALHSREMYKPGTELSDISNEALDKFRETMGE
jgi:multiple sugar transport system substrate-binding protein